MTEIEEQRTEWWARSLDPELWAALDLPVPTRFIGVQARDMSLARARAAIAVADRELAERVSSSLGPAKYALAEAGGAAPARYQGIIVGDGSLMKIEGCSVENAAAPRPPAVGTLSTHHQSDNEAMGQTYREQRIRSVIASNPGISRHVAEAQVDQQPPAVGTEQDGGTGA